MSVQSTLARLVPRDSRGKIADAYRVTRFLISRRIHGFEVPALPQFDPEGLSYFQTLIKTARNYLEYGSGGSTVLACKYAANVVSVDSDALYLKSVDRAISATPSAAKTKLMHADIGMTREWSFPIFVKPTARRLQRWKSYPQSPWKYLRQAQIEPGLILVDGRFRVACVLESLLNLRHDDCVLLLDDYAERPQYRAVEQFADVLHMKGRMAVLKKKPAMNAVSCAEVLQTSYADYR